MSSEQLRLLLKDTDWDEMFGSSPFRYKNVRRKLDARAFPSRIEFGLKGGISPPVSLNNGQRVDFLLARIAGSYLRLRSFDELPTPFRCVAVDLVTAQAVVLDHGSLAEAMRSTMSLPGVFPPMQLDGRVLVDGGAMNNVPANIVRDMGADVVIAVNVGYVGTARDVNYSLLGLMSQTVDAMMEANTRAAMRTADVVINPALDGFGSLDWRKSEALAEAGYQSAEAMKDKLLPYAIDEQAWSAYQSQRQAKRRLDLVTPQFIDVAGAVPSDTKHMKAVLEPYIGRPIDVVALERELETFAGLDRYNTVGWEMVEENGRYGLRVRARPKSNAPPFLMLGISLENLTTDQFAFGLGARYLAFDVAGSGSELRVDGALGAQPRVAVELFRPLGNSPLFVAGSAAVTRFTQNFISADTIVAQYKQTREWVGGDAGITIGRDDEVRVGLTIGHLSASVRAGDPGLPELSGPDRRARVRWVHDGQDSPVVPSSGTRALATIEHVLASPSVPPTIQTTRTNEDLTQASIEGTRFWTLRRRDRLFLVAGGGTSFSNNPLPTDQFQLGRPLRLAAYDLGELRGNHYAVLTGGYLRGVSRLPDFLGGPIFLGGWVENGSAFDRAADAKLYTNISTGAILDTLVGPMVLGASFSLDGRQRYYLGIGRVF
jgi:NTE family protein